MWDRGGIIDQDDFVNDGPVDLRVMEDLTYGVEGASKRILVRLFEAGTGEGSVGADTLEEGIDFDGGGCGGGEGPLCTFTGSTQTVTSMRAI